MTKWRNSFPVRASRRMHEFRGRSCPECGQNDPLLLTKDGRCANCAAAGKPERHHILGQAFRKTKESKLAVIPVSPNAHRLLSDLQAGHPIPSDSRPDSKSFLEAYWLELIMALLELWVVLNYLAEMPKLSRALFRVIAISAFVWFLTHLSPGEASRLVARARARLHEFGA